MRVFLLLLVGFLPFVYTRVQGEWKKVPTENVVDPASHPERELAGHEVEARNLQDNEVVADSIVIDGDGEEDEEDEENEDGEGEEDKDQEDGEGEGEEDEEEEEDEGEEDPGTGGQGGAGEGEDEPGDEEDSDTNTEGEGEEEEDPGTGGQGGTGVGEDEEDNDADDGDLDTITEGDPHFKTWGGKWYDYHGQCDLVMLKAPEFEPDMGLDIHVRTTIRYDYSYIESAAIRIGEDILEISSHGFYSLNSIGGADLSNVFLGEGKFPLVYEHPTTKQHKFDILLDKDHQEHIVMSTFKDLVSVQIHNGTHHHFGTAVGMMGSFHKGQDNSILLARDGKTHLEGEYNKLGQEWQVQPNEPMLFQSVRYPQSFKNEKCLLPDANVNKSRRRRRRLGEQTVSHQDAEKACAHLSSDKDRMAACIFDVMAIGDVEIATAGAY